jgi:hypothetical protein
MGEWVNGARGADTRKAILPVSLLTFGPSVKEFYHDKTGKNSMLCMCMDGFMLRRDQR